MTIFEIFILKCTLSKSSVKPVRVNWGILIIVTTSRIAAVNTKDEEFFKGLGGRIARARKEHGLTQTQLAKAKQRFVMEMLDTALAQASR